MPQNRESMFVDLLSGDKSDRVCVQSGLSDAWLLFWPLFFLFKEVFRYGGANREVRRIPNFYGNTRDKKINILF